MKKEMLEQLKYCLICTFIVGFTAHGYMFMQNTLSYDFVNEWFMTDGGAGWKYALGRFFAPTYLRIFHDAMAIPWLNGIIALFYLGIALFLLTKIFALHKKWMIALTAGFITVNAAMTSSVVTSIQNIDSYMFAMLMCVIATYLWRFKQEKRYTAVAVMLMVPALGIYQSYISVFLTLVMLVCILDLLNGKELKQVWKDGLKAIAMLVVCAVVYVVMMKGINTLTGHTLKTGDYNSLTNVSDFFGLQPLSKIYVIVFSHINTVKELMTYPTILPLKLQIVFHLVLLGITIYALIRLVRLNRLSFKAVLLTIVLLALLPYGMNASRLLNGNYSRDMMHYALCYFYFLPLLLLKNLQETSADHLHVTDNWFRKITAALIAVIVFTNTVTSNEAYLLVTFEKDASISYYSRVLDRIESLEEYEPGTTKVVLLGTPSTFQRDDFNERIYEISGVEIAPLLFPDNLLDYTKNFYKHYLLTNINLVWPNFNEEEQKTVDAMKLFPKESSVQMIGDTVVVKLSE